MFRCLVLLWRCRFCLEKGMFWEPVTINVLGRPLVRAVSSGLKVFD